MRTPKLNYKLTYENAMARQIQTMLERIVGSGKAIVRVAADMNFDQVDFSEEIFDPETQVVRSRQQNQENSDSSQGRRKRHLQRKSGGGGRPGRATRHQHRPEDPKIRKMGNRKL